MGWAIVLLLVVAAFLVVKKKNAAAGAAADVWPVYAKGVLTKHEQPAYWALLRALPDHVVLAQVQLSRMMEVHRSADKRQGWLNKINRKSADFVVCNKDFSVLAVIELDDSSHDRELAKKRDADKDKALISAGIKIIRWRKLPDESGIKQAIAGAS